MRRYNRFKAGGLVLLLVMAMPTSHATGSKTAMAAGAGLLAAGASLVVYGISGCALAKAALKFRDEDAYKNSFFLRFDPKDRLICTWEEKRWPLPRDLQWFAHEHKQEFEEMIKNAANGKYIMHYSGNPFYLLWFHRYIQDELTMIKDRRFGLIIAATLAFGLRDKANGWLKKLDVYEKRLHVIQAALLGMEEFAEQSRKALEHDYVFMAQQNGNLNFNVELHT